MSEGSLDPLAAKGGRGEGAGMGGGGGGGGDTKAEGQASDAVVRATVRPGAGEKKPVPAERPGPLGPGSEDPPGDWLEPLEDDEEADEDGQSVNLDLSLRVNGRRESAIGGGERHIADRNLVKKSDSDPRGFTRRRRGRMAIGEKWLDCPFLGDGWRRKEVFRRSGFSVGKTDTYYMSPDGERVRSKIELGKLLAGSHDLSNFDYKSGLFLDEGSVKVKRKHLKTEYAASTEDGTQSERSFSSEKTGTPERTVTPHSQVSTPQKPRLTPQKPRLTPPQANASSPQKSRLTPPHPNASSPQKSRLTPPHTNPSTPQRPRLTPPHANPSTPQRPRLTPPHANASTPQRPRLTPPHANASTPQRSRLTPPQANPSTPQRSRLTPPHANPSTPQRSRLTPPQANASPHSPSSFCSPPRLVRASPLHVIAPSRRRSVPFGDFSPQRLSVASSPSRDPLFPQLSPAWLDSSLAPMSPTSSLERDSGEELEDPGVLKSSPAFSRPGSQNSPRSDPNSTNGEAGHANLAGSSGPLVYGCSSCGCSYPGMKFRRPGQIAFCPKCKPEKKLENPRNIVFRKWLPCGHCRACQVTADCGVCASCKHALFNPASQKPVRCRRRKCLCPIRKVGQGQWVLGRASETKDGVTTPPKKANKLSKFGRKLKLTKLKRQIANEAMRTPRALHHGYAEAKHFKKHAVPQYSDTEDYPGYYEDNDDMDNGPKKRSRRACWKCDACLRTTDCGSCDFCMDKPKFGGRNKKRQKCRLRQCQSQAMRHLLPYQSGKSKNRSRSPRYRYGGRRVPQTHKQAWDEMDWTNDEDEEGYLGTLRPGMYQLENEEEEDDEDRGEADQDVAAEMTQMNCGPSNGALASEELYVSSYSQPIQDCFQTGPGILNMVQLPAVVLDTSQPLPPLQDPEVLYEQASLPAQYLNHPAMFGKAGEKEDARLVLGEDVEVVQVETGEPEEPDVTPVITQIFSLAGGAVGASEAEQGLLRLLEALRRTVLPAHWVGLMVEGPRLQLLQCSKLSTMADTVVQVEPGAFYQVSVQDQPLLLTHPVYEAHPPRLASVEQVASLLLDLERYTVCQGYPPCVARPDRQPVLCVRAAACGLLVLRSEERCDKCDVTQLVL